MYDHGLVSVVIPAYNREKTIVQSVKSVLDQTYTNIEVIVVDDCSNDNTINMLGSFLDPRLKVFRLEKNSGACVARNFGVSKSKGSFIAFQDSDDIWHKEKLVKELVFLIQNELDFVSCSFVRVWGEKRSVVGMKKRLSRSNKINNWCKLINGNWISTQTIVCKRECFDLIAFDPKIKRLQDWDFGLGAALNYKIGSLNEPLVDVAVQSNSISQTVKLNESERIVLDKHKSDIKTRKMLGYWQKANGDWYRFDKPFTAAKSYFKSFFNCGNLKSLFCAIVCLTGFMLVYKRVRR